MALFGPSIVRFWHPWRVPHRVVLGRESAEAQRAENYLEAVPNQSCDWLSVESVTTACDELLEEQATPR